ncbi:hypothetical protein K440DRAFT_76539 [Wilcoxina mikolae CBS 423.85]|nr:hypothetical protein K440DRAFT_76539 [Wilcoxina mikolae CBS 423.85]
MASARTQSNKRPYELSPPASASTDSKRLKHHASPPALPANFFSPTTTTPPAADPDLDAEWESFQREVVADVPPTPQAIISAPPVPAKEENKKQEEGVSEDIKDENEEAQERLLEEFEEMESLEERVRRLKERREALRRVAAGGGG